jgi:hypothetical protein
MQEDQAGLQDKRKLESVTVCVTRTRDAIILATDFSKPAPMFLMMIDPSAGRAALTSSILHDKALPDMRGLFHLVDHGLHIILCRDMAVSVCIL